ncbi:carboxylesterase [Synechococcus sp. PCC 7336]|uniref:alpha/beta hydrolase n=1 Tax=Synechococcus sp. PCC 7336 TaxID=195250 RepID=UPI00034B4109|nr:alpha/beta fold hydrolase [Synechococcus sp. PCC 7336]
MVEIALKNKPFLLNGTTDRACLLLHGLGGGVYEIQLLGEVLHRQGWTVRGIAYPGHDRPAPKMPRSTWQQWFESILTAYLSLANTHDSVSVVGFSTGCPLALYLAASHPVDRLVLLSPYLKIRYEWYFGLPLEVYVRTLGYVIEDIPRFRLPIRDRHMEAAARSVAFFQTFNMAAVRSAIQLIEDYAKPVIPKISNPIAIVQSKRDSVVAPAGADYIYRNVASADKELTWLTESDHIITLDLERQQVFDKVGTFLAQGH